MAANYVLLERIELNQSATSVTFDNIPQTGYTDLKIVISGRDDRASQPNGDVALQVIYNGTVNTGSIYTQKRIYGSPGTGAGSDGTSGTSLPLGMLDSTTATANTFGSTEIYIPNFTSSNNKTVSCDGVSENNGTVAFQVLNAGLIATSNPITGIKLFSNLGTNLLQYSTFSLYGIAAVGTTPAIAPKADGGNVIATDGTYWYHAFLSNGTFTPQVGLSCDVLVVAGGGGGGGGVASAGSGGGGAGGLLAFTSQAISTAQTVTVGSGGAAGNGAAQGTNGVDSQFGALTLVKGGGGGGYYNSGTATGTVGSTGGSGGGSGGGFYSLSGGSATSGQGNAGGNTTGGAPYAGSGGGGAGAAGSSTNGGAGLNTYSSWASATATGVSGYYAGGGAGGGGTGSNGTAGAGGGGAVYVAGTANTGGGGGGAKDAGTPLAAAGGSGIVIVRYLVA